MRDQVELAAVGPDDHVQQHLQRVADGERMARQFPAPQKPSETAILALSQHPITNIINALATPDNNGRTGTGRRRPADDTNAKSLAARMVALPPELAAVTVRCTPFAHQHRRPAATGSLADDKPHSHRSRDSWLSRAERCPSSAAKATHVSDLRSRGAGRRGPKRPMVGFQIPTPVEFGFRDCGGSAGPMR